MINIKKSNKEITNLLKNSSLCTKVQVFFSYRTFPDDYDSYENNYTDANLNPKTLKVYVREVSSEALVYKQYGLHEMGAKEILCESKYENWFKKCSKIIIEEDEYQVFRESAGQRMVISHRPFNLIRITVTRRTK